MTAEFYHSIKLDHSRDNLLTPLAKDLLAGFYTAGKESIQEALARPALAFCGGNEELAQAIYDDVSKGWAMYASPILSNAPAPDEKAKAMPISCFLSYVPDTREGLVDHQQELAWLSMLGGGVGGHWSDIRAVSEKSVGPIPHIKIADSAIEGYRQGKTRKGSYAAYLDVSHPDIVEYLSIRLPTGGDVNRKCFNIHHAVNIPDEFMKAVYKDAEWNLRCPSTGAVVETVEARRLWESMLETRFKTGEPYLNFIDTANAALPAVQRDAGLKINGSNLCNEIHLATNSKRTAVCCLSSVNLAKWDEWKDDTGFIGRWVTFLDNVLTFFIENAPAYMSKAIYSAKQERAIGLGAMGFHTLLQSKSIPWESLQARRLNKEVFAHIKRAADFETQYLGTFRGEAPDMVGTGRRNSHLLAIAPNANSGLIVGVSPSIEPMKANAFVQSTRAGSHLVFNEELVKVLKRYGKDTEEVRRSIVLNKGSVAHLDFMDDWDKEVFKTAQELNQLWVIKHAAERQPYICQGQSVNLFFPYGADRSYVNAVHLAAHKEGLKGLYYLRTEAGFSGDKVSEKVERKALRNFNEQEECLSCQG